MDSFVKSLINSKRRRTCQEETPDLRHSRTEGAAVSCPNFGGIARLNRGSFLVVGVGVHDRAARAAINSTYVFLAVLEGTHMAGGSTFCSAIRAGTITLVPTRNPDVNDNDEDEDNNEDEEGNTREKSDKISKER